MQARAGHRAHVSGEWSAACLVLSALVLLASVCFYLFLSLAARTAWSPGVRCPLMVCGCFSRFNMGPSPAVGMRVGAP